MASFEVVNELTLVIHFNNIRVHTKVGSMIGFSGTFNFDKEILGPDNGGGIGGAIMGQLKRRLTGENLPLMLVTPQSQNAIGYFANEAQHVCVMELRPGETILVESESILAFDERVRYDVHFAGITGLLSQKGLFTSTLIGPGEVALLTDGNPIALRGPCCVDPDAFVFYKGNEEPQFRTQLSWKNLLGQASGESYFLQFSDPNTIVVIQPTERTSGIDIGIDGKGGKPTVQNNHLFRQDGNQVLGTMGQMMGNHLGPGRNTGRSSGGGIGNMLNGLNNIINS